MAFELSSSRVLASCFLSVLSLSSTVFAAAPTAQEALTLTPIQKDVDYDRPSGDEVAKCTIKAEKTSGKVGWVVRDSSGRVLRNFRDTNGDNKVDQWSYFKDGLEVYRDIDANFNNRADQYRWFNTAGIRWGLDQNEDGRIDSWKVISAEEVTQEVVAALREKDPTRFSRLLLTASELKSLPLGADKKKQLAQQIDAAAKGFKDALANQQMITPKTEWIYFGGSRPGLVPAGTDGSTGDVTVYEHVAAMIDTEGKPGQVPIGTLVRIDETWRLIAAPQLNGDQALAAQGFFFHPQTERADRSDAVGGQQPNEKAQRLMAELEQIDRALGEAGDLEQQSELNGQRADILEKLAQEAGTPEDHALWLRQLADTVSAAVQTGAYSGGVERLKSLHSRLLENPEHAELAAYVQYRYMTAEYAQSLQNVGPEQFAKIQEQWLKDLEKFVQENPKSADAAEAMLQLAIAKEFSGDEQGALKWYDQIVANFPSSPAHAKAGGAKRRLESVGKPMQLQGKSVGGATVDLARLKGKVVLIQYWATWCEPCKSDMPQLKEMLEKYGESGFAIIGVSLDSTAKTLGDYLQENRVPWPQVYEEGGLDSRLANEMGILTLPTMILVDKQGNVVNRNVHASGLEAELKNLLKPRVANKASKAGE